MEIVIAAVITALGLVGGILLIWRDYHVPQDRIQETATSDYVSDMNKEKP